MTHPELDKHDKIGWDFDGTLIEGVNSAFYRQYIVDHPEKTHYIITFRNYIDANTIPAELIDLKFDFRLIKNIHYNPTGESTCGAEVAMFKAERCKQLGATILVDDLPEAVEAGCLELGIVYMNANLIENRPFRPLTLPKSMVNSSSDREDTETWKTFFD